jgi:translation initiation factor 2-alpha kinase 1
MQDQNPDSGQQLFFVLCKRLSRMGIIDDIDFMNEISSVRESYRRAFLDLVR